MLRNIPNRLNAVGILVPIGIMMDNTHLYRTISSGCLIKQALADTTSPISALVSPLSAVSNIWSNLGTDFKNHCK